MLYKTYGRTGAQVSALGMGCMRFENSNDIDAMAAVVLRAFERGVTYFDTAPFYCGDKSEIILGVAVKEMKKTGKPFYVSTKTGQSQEEKIRKELERSLQRLNVDAIDFYHIWCLLRPGDLEQRKRNGVLDTFRKIREEGLIRHVCVSTHLDHDQIGAMLDEGEGLFEGILLGLNAINFRLREQGVREAARRGMGVVTMNTLGGGLIPDHRDRFRFIMRPGDESVIDAALRFNLSLPEVTTALVGFRNTADVDAAVNAVERFEPLSSAEIETFKRNVVESSEEFCTQCNYCRDCPVGIPVVRLMEAYNRRILTGDPRRALEHLRNYWGIPDVTSVLSKCTECRRCEEVCTQHLPILERFEHLKSAQKTK